MRPLFFLDAHHFRAQRVDARIGCHIVFVVGCHHVAFDEPDGDDVLDAVVAVGRIVELAFLVDDADCRFVRGDHDFFDVGDAVAYFRMQHHCAFGGGLAVELRRERNLEQDIFHHVRAVLARELERLAFEQHVVEAPGLRGERRGVAHLALERHQCEPYCAAGGVSRRPRFARAGIGRVAVGAQRLAVDPGVGHRIDHFFARAAQHGRHHCSAGDLDQHDVVEADAVEAVFERDHALDFMRLDHAGKHFAHGQWCFARGNARARQEIGCGEDAAEVVGRMAPFGG